MRLIDADKLAARINRDGTPYFTVCDIENAPTVDAVPVKHAYWKSLPNKLARICSSCEHDEPDKFGDMDVNIFNYCSYCGAKMDGRQNG